MNPEPSASTDAPRSSGEPLQEAAVDLLHSARRQLAALLELATLEARYSGLMLAAAVAAAVIAAVALLAGWGLLVAAAVAWLHAAGWSWSAALALPGLLHAALAVAALLVLRRCLQRIGMDNTRDALGLAVPGVSE